MIHKYLLLPLTLLLWGFTLSAQISHGGRPMMMTREGAGLKSSGQVMTLPAPVTELKALAKVKTPKGRPLRFAHPIFVELTPYNSGHTTVLDDGRLMWQLVLTSPGAYSLNLIFDRFHLVEGDSLFIYNPSGESVLGAFTAENNKPWEGLATAPVPGDTLIVEWRRQNGRVAGGEIMIGAVNHDYLNVFSHLKAGDFGDSDNCHPDLTCIDDEARLTNGRSVCKIIVDGTELCSGTLLNNTRNDGTPYFLTAGHCMGSNPAPESVVFFFNYEVPQCQDSIEGTSSQTISGSDMLAFADSLDFALLKMSIRPPGHYRPWYAGWDLTSVPATPGYTIHHPQGDVKKLAISTAAPSAATFNASSLQGNRFVTNAHWYISRWQSGTTEPGSSGAGLFLENNRFIGLLSGGSASCSDPVNDYFVRLNKIWDHVASNDASVKSWLNPDGGAVTSLPGYDPNAGDLFRLTHFPADATPEIVYLKNGTGFWSGVNSRQTMAVAEHYPELSSGLIYGLYLMPGISKVGVGSKIDVKVWSGVESPQILIGEKKGVSVIGKKNKEMLVMFDEPLAVTGPFFVGYDVDYSLPVDSFGVYQVALSGDRNNSLFVKDPDHGWRPYTYLEPGLLNSSLWIDVLVGQAVLLDTGSVQPPDYELLVAPNPATTWLDIYCNQNGDGWASIIDLSGKVYGSAFVPMINYKARLNLPKLPPGLYLLRFTIDGREMVQKFVVTR